jgi:uncharacterized protein YcaQ
MIKVSLPEARNIVLQSQRLSNSQRLPGREEVLKTIEHLGYVQIDTLAVVERAHHHTLWSRIPEYSALWLDDLVRDKKVFEYWSHAASYLPIKDYRFSLIRKKEYARGKSHWFEQDKKLKRFVLNRIKREGPLQSKDFEAPNEKRRQWYYWKPAKRALEQLFMEGKLMVSHRTGFQKVYDLTEHVLQEGTDTRMPSKKEYAEHLVMSAIQSQGIVSAKEIYYQRGPWNELVDKALRKLLKEGLILKLQLEGHHETAFFGDANISEQLSTNHTQPEIHILSPFDNLLIQRRRTQRLFHFNYTIECYLPEHKRKFGYFTLPVLYGDQFIGRLDPKAERQGKTFYVRNLAFEEHVAGDEVMLFAFAKKLKEFAAFNGCYNIVIERSNKKKYTQYLKQFIGK